MSETNGSRAIQTGTAQGLLEFLDYIVAKGYGSETTAGPQRSATKQVMTITEGEGFGDVDLKTVDLDDLLNRFEMKARGTLKAESIQSYRSRFLRAVEAYRHFLETGTPPKPRQRVGRKDVTVKAPPGVATATAPTPTVLTSVSQERMVDYPFPLKSGALANLRLPVRLDREDAERMTAFIRALVFEPQKQLTVGRGRDDDGS